jgi:hypothetical protein
VDTATFAAKHARLEERLGTPEPLVANCDDLAVRQLVRLLQARALAGSLDLLLEIKRNIAELLLDVTDNFALGRRREGVAPLS